MENPETIDGGTEMRKSFTQAIEERRSYYGLSKEVAVSDDRIQEVVGHAVKYTPSAFNSQSARVLVLLGKEHNKLWNITMEAWRKVVPEESFQSTQDKINSFASAYGTVLYYED